MEDKNLQKHNKREGAIAKIKIALFLCLLILPTVIYGAIGLLGKDAMETIDFDLGEKREKAEIGTLRELMLSGDSIVDYYSDRVPFRSAVITSYRSGRDVLENPYLEVIMPKMMKVFHGEGDGEGIKTVDTDSFDDLFLASEQSGPSTEPSAEGNPSDGNSAEETAAEDNNPEENIPEEPLVTPTPVEEHHWVAGRTQEASYTSYGYTVYTCDHCGGEKKDDFVPKLVDDSYMAVKILEEWTIIGRSGWLFLAGNGNLPYYKGTNLLTEENMTEYTDKMQRLKDLCDAKGITLMVSIAPNKDQVYSEYMPSVSIANSPKREEIFTEYVHENSNVPYSYPLKELIAADRYFTTYYKYDTHWNQMGAFIALQAMYREAGLPVVSPLDVDVEEISYGVKGDLFELGGIDKTPYSADIDYRINYRPEIEVTSRTKGNPEEVYVYRTKSTNPDGGKLVLLGDSYRVNMIPYLEKDLTECTIAHRDYIESVVSDIKEADTLVVAAVERYDQRIYKTIDRLIEILSEM